MQKRRNRAIKLNVFCLSQERNVSIRMESPRKMRARKSTLENINLVQIGCKRLWETNKLDFVVYFLIFIGLFEDWR